MADKPEAREGYEYRDYVFVAKYGKDDYRYIKLDRDCENNGQPASGKTVVYSTKWGAGQAGTIFTIETEIEGSQIYKRKIESPTGWWKNRVDVLNWQAEQRTKEVQLDLAKKATTDVLAEQLAPVAIAYANLRTSHDKAVFIARVMAYIVSGKK